LFDDLL
jgi:hypothetical protein